MSDNSKPDEGRENFNKQNERRIEALLEMNGKYVLTQRHLEQNSSITSLDNLKNVFKLQEERESQMDNLKNIVAYGKHAEVDEVRNIKRNLEFTDHYLQHHEAHMDEATLQKTKEKQEHRKEQLDFLD